MKKMTDKQVLKWKGGGVKRGQGQRALEKEIIGIKLCCHAAWAQLEDHYGITIITHHLAHSISALALRSLTIISSFSCGSGPTRRTRTKCLWLMPSKHCPAVTTSSLLTWKQKVLLCCISASVIYLYQVVDVVLLIS